MRELAYKHLIDLKVIWSHIYVQEFSRFRQDGYGLITSVESAVARADEAVLELMKKTDNLLKLVNGDLSE